MKKFLLKLLLLVAPFLLIILISFIIPAGNQAQNGLLFSQIEKNQLLMKTNGPRIIFIGGSNLSFGLDCQMIKNSLRINPINTSIHAAIGLKYMLRNSLRYVRKGDIIIIAPEYQQFYGDQADGKMELLSMIIDVSPDTKRLVDLAQYFKSTKYIPEYSLKKLDPLRYFKEVDTVVGIYHRKSFNVYGDAYRHWKLPKTNISTLHVSGDLNNEIFAELKDFRKNIELKKAKLFITYPCYQDISFNEAIIKIKAVERKLKDNRFSLLGTPERYKFTDSLLFNTPYHLTRQGVTLRTQLLIDDIKHIINRN